ncbi:MAG: sensor histidine kinase [Moorellaceae bacterium]
MLQKPWVIVIFLLILLEACLAVILNLSIINAPVFPIFRINIKTTEHIVCTLLILTSLALTYMLFRYTEKEIEVNNQRVYIENLKLSLDHLRAQRHDFISHLQVILGFMQLGIINEAREYVQSLCAEISQPTRIIYVNQPALAALLQSKMGLAESRGISWQCEINTDLKELLVPAADITRIFGNLLDNAIEASLKMGSGEKRIWLRIYEKNRYYIFEVGNTGPVIPLVWQEKIFQRGFTTKKDKEGHGQGLFIVKSLVTEYGGRITVQSSSEGTVFIVSFPRFRTG